VITASCDREARLPAIWSITNCCISHKWVDPAGHPTSIQVVKYRYYILYNQ
jgi:hypothetical protein